MLKIEFTQVFHATYQLEESQTLLEWIFEEESSVCSICSPIFLHTFTATFSISWAKSRLDGSQEEQNGMETIWGEAGEGETF